MITKQLLNPESIVVIGASNDVEKPGGKVLNNIIEGKFEGKLYAINPKESTVQGIDCTNSVDALPNVDLAIIAIAAKYIPETVEILALKKNTKAFIILSAGFSEVGESGKVLENRVVEIINNVGGSLIGPNCIGMLTPCYKGSFAGPIPKLDPLGVDFVSGSGATAVFILETAIPMGISFASLFSVGNSAQIGVEDVIKFWDETFDSATSSKLKMIYIETIAKPDLFLKHARSLINKGCRIAAVKSGTTEAGSRAASSHTGALAGSDTAVDALFRKAGIVRCYGREDLAYTAGILTYKELIGDRIAVITHAGGPGVMLTDALSKGKLKVPHIKGEAATELLAKLYHGSSVANPIDFLATGNAEQLGMILDYVDEKFDNIDGSVVIYGTPGLFNVSSVYKVIDEKMKSCRKPIFPVMPSVIQAWEEMEYFMSLGHIYFQDEVAFAAALTKVQNTPKPAPVDGYIDIDTACVRNIIKDCSDGYLPPDKVNALLNAAGIPLVREGSAATTTEAIDLANDIGYPVVMKVIGPVHKSDVGGVRLNVQSESEVAPIFDEMMQIADATGVLIQKMIGKDSLQLFVGAKREKDFGHVVLCGMGGIFIEVLKDVATGLVPLNSSETLSMIRSLMSYKIIKGARGNKGTDEALFAEIISRVSSLVAACPEISEMDINPLLGNENGIIAVDARIRIEL